MQPHRRAALGLLVALLLLPWARGRAAVDAFPAVAAAYPVEADGALLWAGNAAKALPPASLTKIRTALLVSERNQPDAVVRVSAAAALETGARIGLRAGDAMKVRDLLTAALLRSANDACHALADWYAGDERRFDLRTTNALIGRLDGAVGVKSGYTGKAGKCVLALARRGPHEVLLVLLDAPDRWWDAHGLAEAAFAHLNAR